MVEFSQGQGEVRATRPTAELVRRLRDLCHTLGHGGGDRGPGSGAGPGVVSIGLTDLDAALPRAGLERGAVHEWLGVAEATPDEEPPESTPESMGQSTGRNRPKRPRHGPWTTPPLGVLSMLATRVVAGAAADAGAGDAPSGSWLVWVGSRVWPYPPSLVQAGGQAGGQIGMQIGGQAVLERSLFVRARSPGDRLWAIDLALRSPAVAGVVADGSGFDMASTRRLQLAAEAGGGVCLLARPPWESAELSAASTRWLVRHAADAPSRAHGAAPPAAFGTFLSNSITRRWTVELLRCKGLRPTAGGARRWTLERDHATRRLRVVPDLRGGSGVEETPESSPRPAQRLVG